MTMNNPAFKLYEAADTDQSGLLLVNCPHSGRDYSMFDLGQLKCSYDQLRILEDSMMDEVAQLSSLASYGITALKAMFPRSYIDPNRALTSLDKSQMRHWTGKYIDFFIPDKYTSFGSGLVPIDAKPEGFEIYAPEFYPTEEDIAGRLKYYKAYHAQLQKTLQDNFNKFGGYALLDMHSCYPTGQPDETGDLPRRADIILSDCRGQSCSPEFLEVVRQAYLDQGLTDIEINRPFKGGYITSHYGKGGIGVFAPGQISPSRSAANINAIQIEVNKRLYWDFDEEQESRQASMVKEANVAVFRIVDAYTRSLT